MGIGEKSGPINYSSANSDPFGHGAAQSGQESHLLHDAEKMIINSEFRQLVDRNYERAEDIIRDNMDIMEAMADALMKYETIDRPQIENLMARKPAGVPLYPVLRIRPSLTITAPTCFETHFEAVANSVAIFIKFLSLSIVLSIYVF